ncbi:hypothetical protein B9G55_03400 [Saccharibacillus sp. O16]|nr:hypothetical protein B9G55_03400 [Saccharibacillus sp. O16]
MNGMNETGSSDSTLWQHAVEGGRVRGYEEWIARPGHSGGSGSKEWRQYALRKQGGHYQTYFFCVDAAYMDIAEDYAEEEILEFEHREEALAYLRSRGADLSRFAPFKGQKPF